MPLNNRKAALMVLISLRGRIRIDHSVTCGFRVMMIIRKGSKSIRKNFVIRILCLFRWLDLPIPTGLTTRGVARVPLCEDYILIEHPRSSLVGLWASDRCHSGFLGRFSTGFYLVVRKIRRLWSCPRPIISWYGGRFQLHHSAASRKLKALRVLKPCYEDSNKTKIVPSSEDIRLSGISRTVG